MKSEQEIREAAKVFVRLFERHRARDTDGDAFKLGMSVAGALLWVLDIEFFEFSELLKFYRMSVEKSDTEIAMIQRN